MSSATSTRQGLFEHHARASPAVPVFVALAGGIALDRVTELPFWLWIAAALFFSGVWGILWRRSPHGAWSRAGAYGLLAAVSAVGGAWHHLHWSVIAADDLSVWAGDQPIPCRIQGRVLTAPYIIAKRDSEIPSAIPQRDRSVLVLEPCSLLGDQGWRSTSGRTRVEVQGHLPDLLPGTLIECIGHLQRPGMARNPGGFDFRQSLRRQGIHTVLRCEFPEAVQVTQPRKGWNWATSSRLEWQAWCVQRLRSVLKPEAGPVAVAMLLGPRTEISWELREAFQNSGTLHFLAISGINVAILVAFCWPWCRLLGGSTRTHSILMIAIVVTYVAVTDADPPVLRAAVLMVIWLWGRAWGAILSPLNHLAISGIVLLARQPTDLFQVGAQLSFLAVIGLHWVGQRGNWSNHFGQAAPDAEPSILQGELSWWWKLLKPMSFWIGQALLATGAVWFLTLPLVLGRFHLLSPIGFVINIVLAPWMTATLWMGYAVLWFSVSFPLLAWPFARLYELGLAGFLGAVRWAGDFPGGHFSMPGPPEWWLAVCYLLMLPAVCGLVRGRWKVRCWQAWGVWCIVGLLWGLPRTNPAELRCTVLAVGHGAAVVLELPTGETWLYDAGTVQDPLRVQQVVQGYLAERGLTGIDRLWLSHADLDHFNAVVGLVKSVRVGAVCVTPAFVRSESRGARLTLERLISAEIPVQVVWQGNTGQAATGSGTVTADVLYPPAQTIEGPDNIHSLVLSLKFGDHSLLLMGDLEKSGLTEFLTQPPQRHDLLLAPHHGSRGANTPDVARWVAPTLVAISGSRADILPALQRVYGETTLLSATAQDGAITYRFFADGTLSVEHFVQQTRRSSAKALVLPEILE